MFIQFNSLLKTSKVGPEVALFISVRKKTMKTLVQLLKIAMLVTTLSFVMSCDKNNKRSNNTNNIVGNGYTFNQMGQCVDANGYPAPNQTYCQMNQYNNGGAQQCNGNANIYIWGYPDQSCASQPQNSNMGYGCWKSCATTNCSGHQGTYAGSQPGQMFQCY
jgi:hypothetical protein